MSEEFIKSRQNPRVKTLMKLQERSARRKLGLFTVEGLRELSRCAEKFPMDEIYFCPEFFKSREHEEFLDKIRREKQIPLCRLSESAFEKISNRQGCDGLLGVAKQWDTSLSGIKLKKDSPALVLIVDSIEKSGNLGALARTADSFGADAIIITNAVCDIFNPSVIRASQGAVFSIQIAVADVPECVEWLKANKIRSFGAHLKATKDLWSADFTTPSAIVMGSEKDGLGADWENALDEKIIIPMSDGLSDSMNVNVAAAVCLYEAKRSRFLSFGATDFCKAKISPSLCQ